MLPFKKKTFDALNQILPYTGCFGWQKVSWSHFKRKCLGVSPVVAQANHMSGSAVCSPGSLVSGYCCSETGPDLDSAEHSISKAPSGKVKTMATCSCHWATQSLSICCLNSNYMFVFFFSASPGLMLGYNTSAFLREYRLCTTLLHPMRNCTDLKKKNLHFQRQKYTHQMLPPQILTPRTSGLNSSIQDTQQCNHLLEIESFCKVKEECTLY